MLLILTDEEDYTAKIISDWLIKLKTPHKIITANQYFSNIFNYSLSNYSNQIIVGKIDFSEVTTVWYRKWHKAEIIESKISELRKNDENEYRLSKLILNEYEHLNEFLFLNLRDKKWINNYDSSNISKLKQLKLAIESGLMIPKTYIIDKKTNLIKRLKENNDRLITKPFDNGFQISENNDRYVTYTTMVNFEKTKLYPEEFTPSLFQELIKKKVELRVFYFLDEFYSMAIFSQDNKQTEVDFRVFDSENPNRTARIDIPKGLKNKIKIFMTKCNLQTGSLDIILTDENEYIFLEVNPRGQFLNVSRDCGYDLEFKIAEKLTKISHEQKN